MMRKRMLVMLAAVLVAGLVPVGAIAKPPGPGPMLPCNIVDGVLQGYSAGTYGYVCTLLSAGTSTWTVTVTPLAEARHIAFGIKDDDPGAFCGGSVAIQSPSRAPVTGVFPLPESGDCGDPDTAADNDDVFVLWVSTSVRKPNTVSVTVVRQP